jgi:hypothetical protein
MQHWSVLAFMDKPPCRLLSKLGKNLWISFSCSIGGQYSHSWTNLPVGCFPSIKKPVVLLPMQHWSGIAFTLQRTNTENSKQKFPEKELRSHSFNFHVLCLWAINIFPRIMDKSYFKSSIDEPFYNLGYYGDIATECRMFHICFPSTVRNHAWL